MSSYSQIKFTAGQSNAITDVRVLAVIMIVSTHLFQYFNEPIAWWLNVGVQVFLFMSGFLAGAKEIGDVWAWYKKKFLRILLPYYIYLAVVIPIYFLVVGYIPINKILAYILNIQIFTGYIDGLEHLWYMSIIIICYLITPVLQKMDISNHKYREVSYYFLLVFVCLALQALFVLVPIDLNPWMVGPGVITYILGYYTVRRYDKNIPLIIIILLAITTIYFSIFYVSTNILNSVVNDILHILIGSLIFLLGYYFIPLIRKDQIGNVKIIKFLDNHSYEIYLTHHLYILGPMSLMALTTNLTVNILLIIVLILMSSVLLKKAVKKARIQSYKKTTVGEG